MARAVLLLGAPTITKTADICPNTMSKHHAEHVGATTATIEPYKTSVS